MHMRVDAQGRSSTARGATRVCGPPVRSLQRCPAATSRLQHTTVLKHAPNNEHTPRHPAEASHRHDAVVSLVVAVVDLLLPLGDALPALDVILGEVVGDVEEGVVLEPAAQGVRQRCPLEMHAGGRVQDARRGGVAGAGRGGAET